MPTDLQAIAAFAQVIGIMDGPGRQPVHLAVQILNQMVLIISRGRCSGFFRHGLAGPLSKQGLTSDIGQDQKSFLLN